MVFLKEIWEEIIVIVISCDDEIVIVLMIFFDLDVKVNFVFGVVKGDLMYVRFCKEIYDGIEFFKIDFLNSLKLLEYFEEFIVDVVYDYVEIGLLFFFWLDFKWSELIDFDEDYEDVDLFFFRLLKLFFKLNLILVY